MWEARAGRRPTSWSKKRPKMDAEDPENGREQEAVRLQSLFLPFRARHVAVEAAYSLRQSLGRGRFGAVRACVSREDGKLYACKTIRKEGLEPGEITNGILLEVSLTKILSSHPNIVRHVEVLESDTCLHLILEHCGNGDLFSLIEQRQWLPEFLAAPIFRNITAAVQFCHGINILHRDIKPENVLLACTPRGRIQAKLADFGLACHVAGPDGTARGCVGSVQYMAPEVVRGEGCSRASDIWSLGVVLYVMLAGSLPFKEDTMEETLLAIQRGPSAIPRSPWRRISPAATSLIFSMLSLDPSMRPSASSILSSPWLLKWPSSSLSLSSGREIERAAIDIQPSPRPTELKTMKGPLNPSQIAANSNFRSPQNFKSCEPSMVSSGKLEGIVCFSPTPPSTPRGGGGNISPKPAFVHRSVLRNNVHFEGISSSLAHPLRDFSAIAKYDQYYD